MIDNPNGYIWLSKTSEYLESRKNIEKGIIPIIRPDDSRCKRWSRILSWYGLYENKKSIHKSFQIPEVNESDIVVFLDSFSSVSAEIYARVLGKKLIGLHGLQSYDELKEIVDSSYIKSLMLFGSTEKFTTRATRLVCKKIGVPWGFVTAKDLAGLSFTVAKLSMKAKVQNKNYIVIDAINRSNQKRLLSDIEYLSTSQTKSSILHSIIRDNWNTCAIQAHGDGGHIYLDSLMLCALSDNVEQFKGNLLSDGCNISTGVHLCKRTVETNKTVIFLGDIKANYLLIFSCSSALMPGELYPSNTSNVTAISEGYPMAALLTNQFIYVKDFELDIIFVFLKKGIGFGSIIAFVNKLKRHWFDEYQYTNPYIFFGDPSGLEIPFIKVKLNENIIISKNETVVPLKFSPQTRSDIIGVEPSQYNIKVILGDGVAALIIPTVNKEITVKIVDKTQLMSTLYKDFLELKQRLQHISCVELVIQSIFENKESLSSEENSILNDFKKTRIRLCKITQIALQYCKRSKSSGVIDESYENIKRVFIKNANNWNEYLAHLLNGELRAGDIHCIFGKCLDIHRRNEQINCNFCGSPMLNLELGNYSASKPIRHWRDCSLCGEQESWEIGGFRLSFSIEPVLIAGQEVEIEFRLQNTRDNHFMSLSYGWIVIRLSSRVRHTEKVLGNLIKIRFTIPESMKTDLYRLRVTWIHNFNICYKISRVKILGRGKKSEENSQK
jgi:hypothetical protein